MLRYLRNLSTPRLVLWCYFIWYLVVLAHYFDPSPRLWLTALGLSLIIGVALLLNTTASGKQRVRLEAWPTFRLFLTPLCVSSFAALVKDKHFYLIFSPDWRDLAVAGTLCGMLIVARTIARAAAPTYGPEASAKGH